MRKLLTTTALTTGLFAVSLAGAGSASAAVAPQVSLGTIDGSSAVEAVKALVTSGCTTQYANRTLATGSPTLVSVSGLDVTIHGGNALTYTFTQYGSAVVYVLCLV